MSDRQTNSTEAEFFLISYPKCGRTWLRLMLGRIFQVYFQLEEVNLLELEQLSQDRPEIPCIRVTHDDKPQWKKPEDVEISKERYKDKNVIFLVRDPRDVVISNYFQKVKRRQAYEGSLSEFLSESVGSIDTILRFYNIWAENRSIPKQFLLVRYEDLQAETTLTLRRVLQFLTLSSIPDAMLKEAIEYASFENMRKMEIENTFSSVKLSPTDPNDPESYKTRKGKVGGFYDYLSSAEIDDINDKIKKNLSDFYDYFI